ncbi:hypothetical protein [Mesorhizobium caraganae]|uniref:hypothetical protein n=1 Tax=Mesorhizobium caraganae TaxID=483206 RepID=UPI003ECFA01D
MDEDLCMKIARTDLSLTGASSDMATIMSGVATTVEDFFVGAEDGLAHRQSYDGIYCETIRRSEASGA